MSDKPRGWGRFHDLLKKVVRVPKEKVDAKIEADKGPSRKPKKK